MVSKVEENTEVTYSIVKMFSLPKTQYAASFMGLNWLWEAIFLFWSQNLIIGWNILTLVKNFYLEVMRDSSAQKNKINQL